MLSKITPSQAEFRAQVAAWMQDNQTRRSRVFTAPNLYGSGLRTGLEFLREWQHKVWSAGYLGMAWPKEYGGQGMSRDFQRIADEEMKRLQVPICFQCYRPRLGWAADSR